MLRARTALVALALGGCQLAGVESVAPAGDGADRPVVAEGPISEPQEQAAQDLFAQAEASFEARRYLEVLRLTSDLIDRYPAASVSGSALLLGARAELEAGSVERADALAERYIDLLPPGDRRAAEVRLFQVSALEGQPVIQLDRLMRIDAPVGTPEVEVALGLVRAMVDSVSVEELAIAVGSAPPDSPVAAPAFARLSAETLADGDEVEATRLAQAALAAGAAGADRAMAEGVLRGELPEGLRPVRAFTIAVVLPTGGPPALAEFSMLIAEGIEVAVGTTLGDDYQVTVVQHDDQADPFRASEIVTQLEESGVVGAVGFLLDEALVAADTARTAGLPIVSPTARSVGGAGEGIYSLEGANREAARSVALHSVSRAHQRIAMIYPDTPDAAEEADAFAEVAGMFGIPVVGRFPYVAGSSDFESQFRFAQDVLRSAEIAALGLTPADTLTPVAELLEPVGLFMPIPAEDVEFVAPQFAYNGLDTLAIEIVGTSGWTDPQALAQIDTRLVEGVVATAPVGGGPASAGYARFRQAYEAFYQRTLVSPTPAIGYDATVLLLEALRPGRVRPGDVRRSFSALEDVEGATGRFTVVGDRVLRRTEVVRISRGELVPVPIG